MDKKYVRIQSERPIQVTCGLQNKDVTNPDAHVADRLKISPSWPRCSVMILKGAHLYPSEIVEWPTVQALVKDKIITIGEYTDELENGEEKVADTKEKLTRELEAQGITKKKKETKKEEIVEEIVEEKKTTKLADIAGE